MTMSTINSVTLVLHLVLLLSLTLGQEVQESDDPCLNNTLCENSTISGNIDEDYDFDDVNIRELAGGIFKISDSTKTTSTSTTSTTSTTTTESSVNKDIDPKSKKKHKKQKKVSGESLKDNFCGCDLTVSSNHHKSTCSIVKF